MRMTLHAASYVVAAPATRSYDVPRGTGWNGRSGGRPQAAVGVLPQPGSVAHPVAMEQPRALTDQRLRRALALASTQSGVISRRQLYAAGVTRGQVRANVRARRWRRVGSQAVAVHTGPLPPDARHWAAVFEAGPRAMLDGASALLASGLQHFAVDRIRVSVPRGARVRRVRGLDIRQTRRWSADDLAATGVPRTRPAVAAVRAALWARTDKQAALVLTMTVQQGLATAEAIGVEMLRIRASRRRAFVHAVILSTWSGECGRWVSSRSRASAARAACPSRPDRWSAVPPGHVLPRPDLGAVGRRRRGRRHPPLLGTAGGR